jgi:hypothetical protein
MIRLFNLCFAVSVLLTGCASYKASPYETLIKSQFRLSENYRGAGTVEVLHRIANKTKEQFISDGFSEVDKEDIDGYEIINYQVNYDGSYWNEWYQVFRSCNLSGCKHKFILMIGVYA